MIDVQEHVYSDDPKSGHPDVRTYLKDVAYFFLGNGRIQAAIQSAPSGEGTPLGLLIQDPDKLRRKRDALTMDPVSGLEPTQITLASGGREFRATRPETAWVEGADIPEVIAAWTAGSIRVRETFSCPIQHEPLLVREILLSNTEDRSVSIRIRTGCGDCRVEESVVLPPAGDVRRVLGYRLASAGSSIRLETLPGRPANVDTEGEWARAGRVRFDDPGLDRFYQACARQLPAVFSRSGRVDASIWQYNREWVRDHSFMAEGLTLTGHHARAGVLLRRLLSDFVTEEGDCLDSSERRATDDVELDQNGALLLAVREYALWSGDREIVSECWLKIRAAAEFPLRPEFRDPASGLLANRREYWERHAAFGIESGFELMYQVHPSLGLAAAAMMARWIGREDEAFRWLEESNRLRQTVLAHPKFRMIDERGFIKRLRPDGTIQETIVPRPDSGLPAGVPLAAPIPHLLRPDSSTALPIALGFVPPDDPVCKDTLKALEELWNQDWSMGGYGRYHFSSEPDCSGPWPLVGILVARASLEIGATDNVRRILRWLETLPSAKSGAWFELHGDRIAPPYAQIGIIPWAWAETAMLAVRHMIGFRPRENGLDFLPRLLPDSGGVRGDVPFRGRRLSFDLRRAKGPKTPVVRLDGHEIPEEWGRWAIPWNDRDMRLEAVIPEPETERGRDRRWF